MRVLIADDDQITRKMLESNLSRWNYEVVSCQDGESAWRILTSCAPPRLAILDWMMPGLSGVELCQQLRERKSEPYTYLILLTVRGDKHDLVYAMSVGADDYLAKPFDPGELEVRILAGRRILELQETLLNTRRALEDQVIRDPLTGLFNRSAILEILEIELAREARGEAPVGLALADLDHFKRINDTHGHLVGDDALRMTSQCMRASIRPYDSLGRYGGEEFLLVLPGCKHREAAAVAERLRTNVLGCQLDPPASESITVSLGVTSTDRAVDKTPAGLIALADRALYRAKEAGRNRIAIEPPLDTP
jgi:diguanylate cyclase (GGDEF)-like protein